MAASDNPPIRTPQSGEPHVRRIAPRISPRLVDWSLALAGALAAATGLVGLVSGRSDQWPIFALHGAAGLWLLLLLWPKVRRVWPRLVRPRLWDWRTLAGALALTIGLLAVGSGIWWVAGGELYFAGFGLMNWHIVFGFALALLLAVHMLARARPLRRRDVRGRRQALGFGAVMLAAGALWPAQQMLDGLLRLPGARERFTGSREVGSYSGNAFPASSWVADQPVPISLATWHLLVDGAVAAPQTFALNDLQTFGDTLDAILDCTGGFYSAQHWRGAAVGRLLEQARPHPDARYVSFISVTGYRWSLPLDEAQHALLATQAGDEPLAHEHGAPLRLVAPGRRGFEWVKWVVRAQVRTEPDYGEIVAIHTSWLTPAGRGQS